MEVAMWFLSACSSAPLTPVERAAEIRALADGRTSSSDEAEIVALLAGATGAELRAVKRALDQGEEDLHHIVYSDIDDAELRSAALTVLSASGAGLDQPVLRLLSDIDDTVVCTLIDDRFPRGTVYPGVKAFYEELARAARSDGLPVWLTFVSARPADRLELVQEYSASRLAASGFASFTILAGTFSGLASHQAMADTKYARFLEHRSLWPEEQHVFTGDDGQGDPEFGARMLAEHPSAVKAVFIHDVVSDDGAEDRTPEDQGALDRARRLYRFDTYAGAARQAEAIGLLSREAADRVVASTRAELDAIAFADPAMAEARRADLARDVAPR